MSNITFINIKIGVNGVKMYLSSLKLVFYKDNPSKKSTKRLKFKYSVKFYSKNKLIPISTCPLFSIFYINDIKIFLDKPEHPLIKKISTQHTPSRLPPTQQITPPVSLEKPKTRNMATWPTVKRSTQLKKEPYQPMENAFVTVFYIRHLINYSEFNYIRLNDHDYNLDTFFIVHGDFTINPSPFNGNKPVFVAAIILVGQEKYQYLPVYPEPLLIRIEPTNGMKFTTIFLLPNSTIDSILAEAKKLQATTKYIKNEAKQH